VKDTQAGVRKSPGSNPRVEYGVLAFLGVALAALVFQRAGLFTPDTKPEAFLQPLQTAQRFSRSWLDTPTLGSPNYNVGTAPLAALFAALEWLGLPPWLAMRLWRLGLLFVAALGARALVRDLLGDGTRANYRAVAGVAAALAYAANPYVVVGGGTTPTLQPYALLPWLVLCWLRGFRSGAWRWAVLAALALVAMGGVNAGVVPLIQLLVLLPVALHALLVERARIGAVVKIVVGSLLGYAVMSAYWLVPALSALTAGRSVAESTESVQAINMANSFPEVLRGLGMWTLYGADGAGPFDPGRISYVLSPLVVVLTFGAPVLAGLGVLLSRHQARVFGAACVLVGALVMAGPFAGGNSAWGRSMAWAFDTVPGLVAFRTTNKIGGVLELGLAVLVALASVALAERLVSSFQRLIAVLAATAALLGGMAPALAGELFWIPMNIPKYWTGTAELVNSRNTGSRVMMAPGVGIADYAWGYSGPDELGPSLFTRPFVYRNSALSGGLYSAAMLAEVDRRLQLGTLPAGTMSTLAAYLGVGDVVGRYDVVDADLDGARVEKGLDADPGLGAPTVLGADAVSHGAPGAVTVRSVTQSSGSPVRLTPGTGALVIDGSGGALPGLTAAGLVKDRPALLLSGALADDDLASALGGGARMVITDSNLRREWSTSNPTGVGPVLSADEDTGRGLELFEPSAQTTATQEGSASVTASGRGLLFGPFPSGNVEKAFDGDPTTAWRVGNFGTGVGNTVHVIPESPLALPTLTLTPFNSGANWISSVRVTARTETRTIVRDVPLTQWTTFPSAVTLGAERVRDLSITITGVSGFGSGPVGFAEISAPGLHVKKVVSVSSDLARRVGPVAEQAGINLSTIPLDVVLERQSGDENGLEPGEATLERVLTLPDTRTFAVAGRFRLGSAATDATLAALAGDTGEVTVTSSSRLFDKPSARAALALDGPADAPQLDTAWVPDSPVVGEWIAVDFPRRELAQFSLTQNEGLDIATSALVSIDDAEPFAVTLGPGRNTIELPRPTTATRVRVLLTQRSGLGFVRITDLGLPRAERTGTAPECVTVATVGGDPVRAKVTAYREDLLAGESVPLESCGDPFTLAQGRTWVGSVADYAVDLLHLSEGRTIAPRANPSVEIIASEPDAVTVRLPDGCGDCLLSSGQAYDARWRAVTAGESLGAPLVVDGYAAGWRVDLPPGALVRMEYGPRQAGVLAWWVSAAAVAAALTVGLWPWLRRGLRHGARSRALQRGRDG
jgi:arabinofuranan 3-O-arabinosyltransferase